jgi:hypothetical protein
MGEQHGEILGYRATSLYSTCRAASPARTANGGLECYCQYLRGRKVPSALEGPVEWYPVGLLAQLLCYEYGQKSQRFCEADRDHLLRGMNNLTTRKKTGKLRGEVGWWFCCPWSILQGYLEFWMGSFLPVSSIGWLRGPCQ